MKTELTYAVLKSQYERYVKLYVNTCFFQFRKKEIYMKLIKKYELLMLEKLKSWK